MKRRRVSLHFIVRLLLAPVLTLPAIAPAAHSRDVMISEFMADNGSILSDEDGDRSDWIEILNVSSGVVNLSGWYLTDGADDLRGWEFPGVSIAPGDYIVVFASGKDRRTAGSELHTNFKLDDEGEYLALVKPDGVTIEHEFAPAFPKQREDVSYGIATRAGPVVDIGADANTLIPENGVLGAVWTRPEFIPDSTWIPGRTGVGYNLYALEQAGDLLVNVGASDLTAGSNVTQWRNNGTLGGSFNLTLTSSPGYTPQVVEANYGIRPVKFVTTTQSIIMELRDEEDAQISAPPDIIQTADYSVEAWIKLDTTQVAGENAFLAWGRRCCQVSQFNYGDGPGTGAYVCDHISWGSGDVGWVNNCGGLPAPGIFHHLVYTNDGHTTFRIYLDGIQVYTGWRINVVPPGEPITIFNIYADSSLYDGFIGSIARIRVHDGVLTSEQIEHNFVFEASSFGVLPDPDIPLPSTLIGTDIESITRGVNPSIYVRIPFYLSSTAEVTLMRMQMWYDDGFVAYINGTKVYSRNAPASQVWDSAATGEHPGPEAVEPESVNLTGYINLLRSGDNVLAVHGLNLSAGDCDFLVLPKLYAGSIPDNPPGFFPVPSPGDVNATPMDYVDDPVFSVARGFYDVPFSVSISCPSEGASIRYTSDGSLPSETEGLVYSDPVSVTTTTTLRAYAYKNGFQPSNVLTHTYIFLDDVIRQPTLPDGYPTMWGTGTADYAMDPDVVDNPLYAESIKDDLKSVPTISLVVDRDGFFGPGGIYSNVWNRGEEWERPVSVEYFDPQYSEEYFANAGIRLHGGVGRGEFNGKHSLRLLFKKPYGPTKMRFPLFPDTQVERFDSIVLRAGFNFTWNADVSGYVDYIKDQFARDTVHDMGLPASHGRYVHVYINGLYWGLYNVVERPDEVFSADYLGGDEEEYDVLKTTGLFAQEDCMEIVSGNMSSFTTLFSLIEQDMSVAENYAAVEDYLDIPALIDVNLMNCYVGNLDSPLLVGNDVIPRNFYCVRKREPGAGFIFIPWDSEFSLLEVDTNRVDVDGILNPHHLFQRLGMNAEFRQLVAQRIHERFFHDGVLTPDRSTERYMARVAEIDRAIVGESARWGDAYIEPPGTRDLDWLGEVNRIVSGYFPVRTDVVIAQFKASGWYPDVDSPQILLNDVPQYGGSALPGDKLTFSASAGTIYYTLNGADPRMPNGEINPDAQAFGIGTEKTVLIPKGAVWKYLDDGSDQGSAWFEPEFDDGAWPSGPAQLGYGDGDETTTVGYGSNMLNKYTTTYFRTTFNRDPGAPFAGLTLELLRDDGAVVYLNGREIVRSNLPDGTISYNTLSVDYVADADESIFYTYEVDPLLLSEGTNVVAVEIHQYSGVSSDISFDLELAGAAPSDTSIILMNSVHVKTRALNAGEWSVYEEGVFVLPSSPGDVVISEVMPNAVGQDDNKEWFEVFNTTDFPINIDGWVISDNGTDTHTIAGGGSLIVPAKSHLVLGESADPLVNGGVPVGYAYGPTDITLANDGDEIILSQAGQVIHAIGYEAFSNVPTAVLDTRQNADPGLAIGMGTDYCDGPATFWQVQTSFYGEEGNTGTPGAGNDDVNVCSGGDTLPPELVKVAFGRRNLLYMRFNEPVDASTAENELNYTVDNSVGNPTLAVKESAAVVLLEFAAPLLSDVTYTVTVQSVEDLNDNAIVSEQYSARFHTPKISITEIMYDNRGIDVEWIELLNTTGSPINVSGWYLTDDDSYPAVDEGRVTLPPGTVIDSGQYVVVNVWDDVNFGNWHMPGNVVVIDADLIDLGSLSNTGDNLVLYNSADGGDLIDGSASTDYPDLTGSAGESIEKIDELFPWGDVDTVGYNFRKCVTPLGFTTGTDDLGNPLSDCATPGRTNVTGSTAKVDMWELY